MRKRHLLQEINKQLISLVNAPAWELKSAFMQVNEHLERFSQRPLSVHSKGLPANCSKVSQLALIGQSQGGFVRRRRARRGLHHLFVSLLLCSTDLTCLSVPSLLGIGVLDTTKKVTEQCWARDYDLLICFPPNSKLAVWGCDVHTGE